MDMEMLAQMKGPQKTVSSFRHRGFWDVVNNQTVMIFGDGAEPEGLRKLWDNLIVQEKTQSPWVEPSPTMPEEPQLP